MVEALQRTDTPRNESYQTAREKKKQIWKKNMEVQHRNLLYKKYRIKRNTYTMNVFHF